MRSLVVSLVLLAAVVGGERAYALNPQPLPPGIRAHIEYGRLNPQPLPPRRITPHHVMVPRCPPKVNCLS